MPRPRCPCPLDVLGSVCSCTKPSDFSCSPFSPRPGGSYPELTQQNPVTAMDLPQQTLSGSLPTEMDDELPGINIFCTCQCDQPLKKMCLTVICWFDWHGSGETTATELLPSFFAWQGVKKGGYNQNPCVGTLINIPEVDETEEMRAGGLCSWIWSILFSVHGLTFPL